MRASCLSAVSLMPAGQKWVMINRVAGICYIKVDFEQIEVSGGVEVPLVDLKGKTVMMNTPEN